MRKWRKIASKTELALLKLPSPLPHEMSISQCAKNITVFNTPGCLPEKQMNGLGNVLFLNNSLLHSSGSPWRKTVRGSIV
jgi:hypothetical protein